MPGLTGTADPATGLAGWRRTKLRLAAGRLLVVAFGPVRDLLLCAKHLFFAAILAGPPASERDTSGLCASAWRGPRSRNGIYGMLARGVDLFGLDVGRADHLGPFFGFDNYELTKFDGRHRHWLAAEFSETCF